MIVNFKLLMNDLNTGGYPDGHLGTRVGLLEVPLIFTDSINFEDSEILSGIIQLVENF
jgi:hypothetical protein